MNALTTRNIRLRYNQDSMLSTTQLQQLLEIGGKINSWTSDRQCRVLKKLCQNHGFDCSVSYPLGTVEQDEADYNLVANELNATEHFRQVFNHKLYIMKVFKRYQTLLQDRGMTENIARKHDDSKVRSMNEVIGYSLKWIWKVKEDSSWSIAWKLHYQTNSHHPEFYYSTKQNTIRRIDLSAELTSPLNDLSQQFMPDCDLTESVVDMLARRWENKSFDNPSNRELAQVEDHFLDRYSPIDKVSVQTLLATIAAFDSNIEIISFCSESRIHFEYFLQQMLKEDRIFFNACYKTDISVGACNGAMEGALNKARDLWWILKKELIVDCCGIRIHGLKSPFNSFFRFSSDSPSVEAILELVKGITDVTCEIESCLVYIQEDGVSYIFNDPKETRLTGKLARTLEKNSLGETPTTSIFSKFKPNYWSIFIPNLPEHPQSIKRFTQLSDKEIGSIPRGNHCFRQFRSWFRYRKLSEEAESYLMINKV